MPPGIYNSSLTRVQPYFQALFERDETGSEWLGDLLVAAPHGCTALGEFAAEPGFLLPRLLGSHPSGKAERACFEYDVPPDPVLLEWFARNPDKLSWPAGISYGEDTTRMRRALLYDEAPGRADAETEALRLVRERPTSSSGWWRFEGSSSIDCLLITDRVVVTVEGKRTEPLSAATDWYAQRTQIVRNLEAAQQLARGRRWGTLVISEEPLPDASSRDVAASLDEGAPHLDDAGKAKLQAAYLGNITWAQACAATGVSYGSLPDTIHDV